MAGQSHSRLSTAWAAWAVTAVHYGTMRLAVACLLHSAPCRYLHVHSTWCDTSYRTYPTESKIPHRILLPPISWFQLPKARLPLYYMHAYCTPRPRRCGFCGCPPSSSTVHGKSSFSTGIWVNIQMLSESWRSTANNVTVTFWEIYQEHGTFRYMHSGAHSRSPLIKDTSLDDIISTGKAFLKRHEF